MLCKIYFFVLGYLKDMFLNFIIFFIFFLNFLGFVGFLIEGWVDSIFLICFVDIVVFGIKINSMESIKNVKIICIEYCMNVSILLICMFEF